MVPPRLLTNYLRVKPDWWRRPNPVPGEKKKNASLFAAVEVNDGAAPPGRDVGLGFSIIGGIARGTPATCRSLKCPSLSYSSSLYWLNVGTDYRPCRSPITRIVSRPPAAPQGHACHGKWAPPRRTGKDCILALKSAAFGQYRPKLCHEQQAHTRAFPGPKLLDIAAARTGVWRR